MRDLLDPWAKSPDPLAAPQRAAHPELDPFGGPFHVERVAGEASAERPVARGLQLALSRIADDGCYFVRSKDIRLWVVDAKGVPANVWRKVATALESQPESREVFLAVDEPFGHGTEAFERCARRLVEAWHLRPRQRPPADDASSASGSVPVAPAVELAFGGPPRQTFARVVRGIVRAVRAPHEGVVVLLAPTSIDTADTIAPTLEAFVASPALERVRWVFVHDGSAPLASLCHVLGGAALVTDARVPEDDLVAGVAGVAGVVGMEAVVSRSSPALHGAPPSAPPKSGIVPRPISVPPPTADPRAEELAAEGIPAELITGGSAARLRRCLLEAANAARRSRLGDAVQWQKQACEVAQRLGMSDAHLVARMVLAGYLELGRRPEYALREYTESAEAALAAGDATIAAHALLRVGLIEHLAKRHTESAAAYTRAAELARRAGVPVLALDAFERAAELARGARASRSEATSA